MTTPEVTVDEECGIETARLCLEDTKEHSGKAELIVLFELDSYIEFHS